MLIDNYDRSFKYLRLSLTEKCNFRCSYCLPNGFKACRSEQPLDHKEIRNLVRAFVSLGVEKIRLTGGEPTIRHDIIDIISTCKQAGIAKIALTTNGFRLGKIISDLNTVGLDGINISLDSLQKNRFQKITGSLFFDEIYSSIESSLKLKIPHVKINAVLLKDINSDELIDFTKWVKDRKITVRFIELMKTLDNSAYFREHHLSADHFENQLKNMGWKLEARSAVSGPAKEYSHPDYKGKIGFISPYSKDFCLECNRLRVSSFGELRLCLFGQGNLNLRPLLQNEKQFAELKELICEGLRLKPMRHELHRGLSGDMNSLAEIGG